MYVASQYYPIDEYCANQSCNFLEDKTHSLENRLTFRLRDGAPHRFSPLTFSTETVKIDR
jgi:hypothetical protein